jgi:PAS domain S-box-containing protein
VEEALSIWSIPVLIMAGITLFAGANHLLVFLRVRNEREHLAFAALCGTVTVYNLLCAGLYSVGTPQAATPWQVGLAYTVALTSAAFVWFVSEHLDAATGRVLAAIAAVSGLLLILLAATPTAWLITAKPLVRHVALPFGLSVTYLEMAVGPLFLAENVIVLAAIAYAMLLAARRLQTAQRAQAMALLVAAGVFSVTAISDALAASGVYSFVYLAEYGFGAIVVLMTIRLSSELVRIGTVERELAERERGYRELFNATSEAIFVYDADTGAILDVNQAVVDLFGYTRQEALGLTIADLSESTTGSGQQAAVSRFAEATSSGTAGFEGMARRKSGDELWVEVNLRAATLGGRRRVLAVVRDISDRRRAEEALRASQRFHETIVAAIPGIVYIWDIVARRPLFANQNGGLLLGYTPEEVAAMGESLLAHIVHPDDMEVVAGLLSRWDDVTDDEVLTSEYRVRTRSGELRWWFGRDKILTRGPDGRVQQIIGSVHDITERRRAELALQESEARYRTLVEASPSGILLIDREGTIAFANPVAYRICGLPGATGLVGRSVYELVVPEDHRILEVRTRAVLSRRVQARPFRLRLKRPDNEVRHMDLVGVRVFHNGVAAVLGVGNDVTEQVLAAEGRSRLERQLREAQKMEAVGRLAGGVAHDFNNLLQAILGYAEVLATRVSDPEAVTAGLGELAENARRGARLTRQLLVFSRREATRPESLELSSVIADATTLVRRLLRESIRLDVALADEPLLVHADRGQIEQVVMNLAVNAADAMPSGGVLTIRTGGGPDGRVWLEVTDTGHGIAEHLREQIFEPFFTTKAAAEGTGLGLSVVHAIVTQHHGSIELDSRVGGGTTFRILLPRQPSREPEVDQGRAIQGPALVRGEGRRVLVVEDEAGARQVLGDILTMLGFDVVTAPTAAAARALPPEPPFALLLSDVVLPDGVGNELAAELQARWPSMVIILMSGYAQDSVVRTAVSRGEVHFLQKPFGLTLLAQELSRALATSPQVPPAP